MVVFERRVRARVEQELRLEPKMAPPSSASIFELPSQVLVQKILNQVDSLRDISSFGRSCREARRLLEAAESSELWSKFCPKRLEPDSKGTRRLALSHHKLQRILESGCCSPKPATFYYRFQPKRQVVGISDESKSVGITELVTPELQTLCESPTFIELLSLGSVPTRRCPFFTLVRSVKRDRRSENTVCFLIYSEDTRTCLYEAEFSRKVPGKILRLCANRAALSSEAEDDDLAELGLAVERAHFILREVFLLNSARAKTLGKISVLHQSVKAVRSLSKACGVDEYRVRSCKHIEDKSSPFIVTVIIYSDEASPSSSARPRASRRVSHLYRGCEQIKEIGEYLASDPKHLERVVVCCSSEGEVKRCKRIVQSIMDHAFLLEGGSARASG